MHSLSHRGAWLVVAFVAAACGASSVGGPEGGSAEAPDGAAPPASGGDGAVDGERGAGSDAASAPEAGSDAGSDAEAGSAEPPVFDESKCTVFVDAATGSDANGGKAKSAAKKSVQAALNVVAAGDTVCVYPGTYPAFKNTVSGSASARIHLVSVQRWMAKVSDSSVPIWNNGDYVDIDGFEVTATSDSVGVGIDNGDGKLAEHCRIFNNHVHHIVAKTAPGEGGAGILSAGWSSAKPYQGTDVEIFGNLVHDIGHTGTDSTLVQGIYVGHPQAKIYDNIVYTVSGWGIHGWHNANYVIVSNNLTSNTGGIVLGNGDDPCGSITCAFTDYYVTNNILYADRFGVSLYAGPNHTIANNAFFSTPSSGTDARTGDPKFVKYALDGSGDFHLDGTSPLVGAGLGTYAPAFDFDGKPRPQGAGVDIGPYQH